MSAANVANVTYVDPPAPPGPYTFDRSRFSSGTRIVDTANLAINANVVNCYRLKAYGDPNDPNGACISAPTLATQVLLAPYFDASGNPQVNPTVIIGNACTYFTQSVFVQQSVTVGKPFSWIPPPFVPITSPTIRLNGSTFGQAYPLGGGQLRGFFPLTGIPQPPLATQGSILSLNGGTVAGNAVIYH